MTIRLGAPTETFKDAALLAELRAPPTGNSTVRRNDLLQLLADTVGHEHARFNKKNTDLTETENEVLLTFSDGSTVTADVVIACDGIHSAIRQRMLGSDHPASRPQYSGTGVYRAVLPVEDLERAIGPAIARTSTVLAGPGAYLIMYPVELGSKINIGFWGHRPGNWDEREWVVPHQKKGLEDDFSQWGETAHKVIDLIDDPSFWPAFYHASQPDSVRKGRVLLIGDAAHSMPPHQGAGAGQAMEDAYVLSETIGAAAAGGGDESIDAALKAFEQVRTPRSQRVLQTSVEAMGFWSDFYRPDLSEEDVRRFERDAQERFPWIWNHDLAAQARRGIEVMSELGRS